MHTLLATLLLILLGVVWGSGFTLAKYAMTNGVPPLGYSFWQSIGPAIVLSLFCLIHYGRQWLNKGYWRFFLICGLTGIAIPNTNIYLIAEQLPAGMLALLVNTTPLFIYPLALLTHQERFNAQRLTALLLGMAGIFLIVAPAGITDLSYYTMIALISPLAYAIGAIYIAGHQPSHLNALQAASGMLLATTLLLTPLVIQQHAFYPLTPPYDLAKGAIILEIVLSSLGYFLFFKLIRMAGAVYYSLTSGVVAITGLLWGLIIFGETLNPRQLAATGLVISAIFLLSWSQKKQQEMAT